MEMFQFVEQSFDIDLINRCKTNQGSKSIKKINSYLRELSKSEVSSNNLKVTINNENNNNKNQHKLEKNINNNLIFESYEKENTTSEAENTEKYLSD